MISPKPRNSITLKRPTKFSKDDIALFENPQVDPYHIENVSHKKKVIEKEWYMLTAQEALVVEQKKYMIEKTKREHELCNKSQRDDTSLHLSSLCSKREECSSSDISSIGSSVSDNKYRAPDNIIMRNKTTSALRSQSARSHQSHDSNKINTANKSIKSSSTQSLKSKQSYIKSIPQQKMRLKDIDESLEEVNKEIATLSNKILHDSKQIKLAVQLSKSREEELTLTQQQLVALYSMTNEMLESDENKAKDQIRQDMINIRKRNELWEKNAVVTRKQSITSSQVLSKHLRYEYLWSKMREYVRKVGRESLERKRQLVNNTNGATPSKRRDSVISKDGGSHHKGEAGEVKRVGFGSGYYVNRRGSVSTTNNDKKRSIGTSDTTENMILSTTSATRRQSVSSTLSNDNLKHKTVGNSINTQRR
jgi:hypothetical protein